MGDGYVHGYDTREGERLRDQADVLVDPLHGDTAYPAGSEVLEAGCGVGAQTVTLARRSPGARITAMDLSAASLAAAESTARQAGLDNVTFRQGDILDPPFPPASFDHVFLCFVLEHLARPDDALRALTGLLRPGGTLTVIEGDHGSAYFHPDDGAARAAIACLVDLQRSRGGNALIGRELFPRLTTAGLRDVRVSPRTVYVDGSRPDLADSFTLRTFTAMIAGIREPAIEAGLTSEAAFDAGLAALRRTAEPDGVFLYTFFKGVGCI